MFFYCAFSQRTTHDNESVRHNDSQQVFFDAGQHHALFLLLIVVLLVTMGVITQSAVNTWLKDKSYQIVDITHALHKRIDTYRYATWQIYDNIAPSTSPANEGLQETRLRQDVYYLEKPRRKTEALIFGSHDSSTLEMSQRISSYLDTLWGAENVPGRCTISTARITA